MTAKERAKIRKAIHLLSEDEGFEDAIEILLQLADMRESLRVVKAMKNLKGITPDDYMRKYPLTPDEIGRSSEISPAT